MNNTKRLALLTALAAAVSEHGAAAVVVALADACEAAAHAAESACNATGVRSQAAMRLQSAAHGLRHAADLVERGELEAERDADVTVGMACDDLADDLDDLDDDGEPGAARWLRREMKR